MTVSIGIWSQCEANLLSEFTIITKNFYDCQLQIISEVSAHKHVK